MYHEFPKVAIPRQPSRRLLAESSALTSRPLYLGFLHCTDFLAHIQLCTCKIRMSTKSNRKENLASSVLIDESALHKKNEGSAKQILY